MDVRVDHKETWVPKNWCFWTVVLEKTIESPLDCKEFKPVNPKGSQSWMFFGRTDAEAEAPILWPSDVKNWLIGKDSDAGKDQKAGGEGDDRERDGWMASTAWWTCVWARSRSWWWTRKPGMLQSMGSQRHHKHLRHNRVTELNWTDRKVAIEYPLCFSKCGPYTKRIWSLPAYENCRLLGSTLRPCILTRFPGDS